MEPLQLAVLGTVIHGAGDGQKVGYPTANLALAVGSGRAPAGIYAGWVRGVGAGPLPALLVSGVAKEPQGEPRQEVYVVGWSGDLYGRRLGFEVVARLRDVVQLPDLASLRAQIASDVAATRQLLGAPVEPAPP